MKLELPLAIGLLALGCTPWVAHFPFAIEQNSLSLTTSSITATQEKSIVKHLLHATNEASCSPAESENNTQVAHGIHHPTELVAASYQRDDTVDLQVKNQATIPRLDETETKQANPAIQKSGLTSADFIVASNPGMSDSNSNEFLRTRANVIANSNAFGATVSVAGNVFSQKITANGQYFQMGQGSAKARLELQFGEVSEKSPVLIQLCDGRFLYSIQSRGPRHNFEFVDADKIKRQAIEYSDQTLGPLALVSTGGISGILSQLASTFQFNSPIVNYDGTTTIRGSWRPENLKQVVSGKVPADQPLHWNTLPKHIPHAVEITFSNSGSAEPLPSLIRYFQFVATNDSLEVHPFISIGFGTPQLISDLDEKFFVLDSKNLESVDKTNQYLSRIDSISKSAQKSAIAKRSATQETESVER